MTLMETSDQDTELLQAKFIKKNGERYNCKGLEMCRKDNDLKYILNDHLEKSSYGNG